MDSLVRCSKTGFGRPLRQNGTHCPTLARVANWRRSVKKWTGKFFWRTAGLSPTLEILNQQQLKYSVATVSNIRALQVSIALAERQVQRDQTQVQEDSVRLSQSQAQLARDQRQLSQVVQEGRAAQARVNTQGETIGKLIDTVA
jgi:hypothetical protein